MDKCFDSKKYLKLQKEKIEQRVKMFDKLYIEFGGKLVDDYHAARVLPGFEPDIKIKLIQQFKDKVEVLLCINANDIQKNKIRSDRVISYDDEIIRLIEFLRDKKITVNNIVITLYDGQPGVTRFINKLKDYNIKAYLHTFTKGYPTDVDTIVSDEGYGANPYVETTKPIVVVSAPGACSGKLATCLSQLYHEYKKGVKAGYAKYETFPIWNYPLKHPVNLAYEAATADISDVNMIDYFHLEKYGVTAVNYNRDLEMFPVLKKIIYKITGETIYNSPTDMGVNVIKDCVFNDKVLVKACNDEILRRYYKSLVDVKKGIVPVDTPKSIKLLLNELGLSEKDRPVIEHAFEKKKSSGKHAACICIGKKFICGKQTDILSPISSVMINALKTITKVPDRVDVLSPSVLQPVLDIKERISNFKCKTLKLDEVMITLSISSATNPVVEQMIANLRKLKGAQLHATYMIPDSEMVILNNLGINVTCEVDSNIG